MKPSISKMAIVSPSREVIWWAIEGPNQVLWIKKFKEVIWELTLQERHYKDRRGYSHEALLQKAVCVIHPDSWTVLTTQGNDNSSILITGSGKKDFRDIVTEKTSGLETGIAEQNFWECYALTEDYKWPLYVFHTRIVIAHTQGAVTSLIGHTTSWKNPQKAMEQVGAMEKNIILWLANEIQKKRN